MASFQNSDFDACFGGVDGGLQASHSSADNQYIAGDFISFAII
jgi:hypothetical protein